MTPKDYSLIARVIRETFKDKVPLMINVKTELIENLAAELKKDNHNFSREIFLKMCINYPTRYDKSEN